MKNEFPPTRGTPLCDRYYDRGREIFATFEGFPPSWEIIGAELKVQLVVGGYEFTGFIDLLIRDKNTGKLAVVDHKSKSKFKTEEEKEHYAIQLYLYSQWVYETYGEYPALLIFNMFRVGDKVVIPFNKKDLQKALDWFVTTIEKIYKDVDFWDKITTEYEAKNWDISKFKYDDFFCKYLCGSRMHCRQSGLNLN